MDAYFARHFASLRLKYEWGKTPTCNSTALLLLTRNADAGISLYAMRRLDELAKLKLFNRQEVALINNQLNMADSKCEGDTSADFQKKEYFVQDSDAIKVKDEVVDREGKGLERDEGGVEHIKEETMSRIWKQKAPPFMSDGLLSESRSLLRKNAMHEEATDEDKAWLASLSDVEVDMLISIKKLAMERAKTIKDKCVMGIFTSRVLRTIGLLLKEFIRERLKDVHFQAQATDTLSIHPNNHENMFSPKVEEENDNFIHGHDVGEVWTEMTVEQNRKRKRHVSCEQTKIELNK